MITNGFYCDHCRQKYPVSMCEKALPCGHDKSMAFYVFAEVNGRHSERVIVGTEEVRISKRQDDPCFSASDYLLWGSVVIQEKYPEIKSLLVGEWLASKEEGFIRAFFARWEKSKTVPLWLSFKAHKKAILARAIIKI